MSVAPLGLFRFPRMLRKWWRRASGPAGLMQAQRPAPTIASIVAMQLALAGCDYDVAISSIYVPPWLVCSVLGSGLAAGLLYLATRTSAAPYVGNRSVLFLSLTVIFAVLIWAVLFKG